MTPPEGALVFADENIGRSLIQFLRQRGLDVLSVGEVRRQGALDEDQLAFATADERILLTHDHQDFVRLHRTWLAEGRRHAGIVTVPQAGTVARQGVRAALLIAWLLSGGEPASRLAVWGHLQPRLRSGLRLPGFSERDLKIALGLVEP